MPKSAKLSFLAISVVALVALFLGVNWHGVHAAEDKGQEGAYRQINVYGEVLEHIQADYVEEPNIPAVTRGALRGLLESLDADSSYLSAADYKAWKDAKAGRAQTGINIAKRYGYATVVSVVPGSPADKADLDDGDIIEAVEGKDTRDLSLATIQMMMEGAPGSTLKFAVLRPRSTKPDPVELTRVVLQDPPVQSQEYENSSIEYLRPMAIDKDHVSMIESKLRAAEKGPTPKKILLDLRDSSTGEMSEGVRLANFFVGSGTLATLQGQKVAKQEFTADPAKVIDAKAPVIVLVNRGTAGPAELVAAAIADNKRGELVGERTFGEGVQTKVFEMGDGSALIMTVAKYAAPDGKTFEGKAGADIGSPESGGVIPGTLVASNFASEADASGAGAIPTGSNTKNAKPAATEQAKPSAAQPDDQLNKGLELLKKA